MATPQNDGPEMFTAAASSDQPEGSIPSLFQPLPVPTEASFSITAAHAGLDINDGSALQAWLQAPVTTRQDVLQTLRNYHVAVIRPEVDHMIAQVENIIGKLDARMLRLQDDMNWLASENRAAQKRESGLIVVLTGFDPKMEPAARYDQINWMLGQIEDVKQFLFQRQYNATDTCQLYYLSALQTYLSTSPAGEGKWSTVTTIIFKSWDLRKSFMAVYGGGKGTPLWKDGKALKGFHIRCTPSSPQFQRKLELPVRVTLNLINKASEMNGTPPEALVILWRTLSSTGDFDPQGQALARKYYFEQEGQFKGRLEITKELATLFKATPPTGAEEPTF